jgi:signal transduction histidine kinase
LGLAICSWIAEVHKGRINVQSALGRGSTFTVTLPLASLSA